MLFNSICIIITIILTFLLINQGGYYKNRIDVRQSYPDKWVVLEGLKTRIQGNHKYYEKLEIPRKQ